MSLHRLAAPCFCCQGPSLYWMVCPHSGGLLSCCPACQSSLLMPGVCFANLLIQSQCSAGTTVWKVGKEYTLLLRYPCERLGRPRGLLEPRMDSALASLPGL